MGLFGILNMTILIMQQARSSGDSETSCGTRKASKLHVLL